MPNRATDALEVMKRWSENLGTLVSSLRAKSTIVNIWNLEFLLVHFRTMPGKTEAKVRVTGTDIIYLLFVILTSFFTYFYNYGSPQAVFWDEPYHIAAAQKYQNGVFFMEQHPPLGKLLIALGEELVNANEEDDTFIKTDYAKGFDSSFSFVGYRLFGALLAWLTAPLLFLIFFTITRSSPLSALLSFLYIFDNAEIVHARGAMVDSPLTFFGILCILLFLLLDRNRKRNIHLFCILSLLLGASFGAAITTKVVALIFVILFGALLFRLVPDWQRILLFSFLSILGFAAVFISVWHIHFSLSSTVIPELSKDGYYEASEPYKDIVAEGRNRTLSAFPVMLRDSLNFITTYNKFVPRLDLCKPDENGSPAYFWPFGARTINYRWEKTDDGRTRYLYLVSNPVSWGLGLLGVVLAGFFLLSRILLPQKEPLRHGFELLLFSSLYGGYMITISQLSRVMYLYHYFLPLLFSFILFCLVLENIQRVGPWKIREGTKIVGMTIVGLLIFGAFQFYRPLTYYEPMSNDAFKRRVLVPLWELTCVECEKKSGLVVPRQIDN